MHAIKRTLGSGALAQEADHGLAVSECACCVHCEKCDVMMQW